MARPTCPDCSGPLRKHDNLIVCDDCGARFRVVSQDGKRKLKRVSKSQPQVVVQAAPQKKPGCVFRFATIGLVLWTLLACVVAIGTYASTGNVIEDAPEAAATIESQYAEAGSTPIFSQEATETLWGVTAGLVGGSALCMVGCVWLVGFIVLSIIALITKP
ncbi:MAG: hypothetical protein JXB47_03860 [Anaerolineae bacterium]|nr:hypothetical protein [Anaerolineae bacterium]